MANFNRIVNDVMREADIVLMILDARNVEGSRNPEIEKKVKAFGKKLIYVVNKCDLLEDDELKKIKLPNSVKMSAKNRMGTIKLMKKMMEVGKGKSVTIGVVGYPNTGKSTVINSLKGKHSAPSSSVSGFTKSLQKIRVSKNIMLIDTPGVFSYSAVEEKKNLGLISIGTINPEKLKDPEETAADLIMEFKGKIEKFYGVEIHEDPYDTLEKIAIKKKILKKGGIPDTKRLAMQLLKQYQSGKIR